VYNVAPLQAQQFSLNVVISQTCNHMRHPESIDRLDAFADLMRCSGNHVLAYTQS